MADIGALSKRNFHRPESNCEVALNLGCKVFIKQTSQMFARAESPELVGSAHHGYYADEEPKCSKREICFPPSSLKRSKTEISSYFAPRALRRIVIIRRGKQDALRSFSEGGPFVYYVYLIESVSAQRERYVGMTTDLKERLQQHNAGKSSHTSKFKPWALAAYVAFTDPAKAEAFERYLKSGSGHAFARKRLW